MSYGIISVAAAPVRKKADHRAEMVNQLLFGEPVRVLKQKNDIWAKVKSLYDGYEGWMQQVMLNQVDKTQATAATAIVTVAMFSELSMGGNIFNIPAGSSLPLFSNAEGKLGDQPYTFAGPYLQPGEEKPSAGLLQKLLMPWVNVPYLWGGRTPMGIDCSGLVQLVFKQMGITLPRDAWQQAEEGNEVKKLKDAQPGDLAFFQRDGRIIHVGIILPDGKIIHSSGKVRIDNLTRKGIVNAESDKLMVKLERIKRLF